MRAIKIEPKWRERLLRGFFGLLVLVLPALMGVILVTQWRWPTIGVLTARADSATITGVIPGSPIDKAGLRVGDVILTVNSIPIDEWLCPQYAGQILILEIDRDGQRFSVTVQAVHLAQLTSWRLVGVFAIPLILWGASTFLLWRRLHRQEIRLLFLLGQLAAIAVLPAMTSPRAMVPWPLLGQIRTLSSICVSLATPMFLHYHLTFPVRLGNPRQRRWVLGLAYGLVPFVLTAGLTDIKPWAALATLCLVLQLFVALGAALYVYQRRASPDDRRRLRLIVFGTVLGLSLPVLIYTIPYHAGGRQPLSVPSWVATSFVGIVPLSYIVATARHNLFGIDRLINRALVYGLLSLGIFSLYLGPFLALTHYAPDDPLIQTVVVAGLTLLVGLGFSWTRERVQRLVDRLFYGGWYDYPGVVETISDALAHSLNREQLSDVLTGQVADLMQLHVGHLWLGDPGAVPAEKPPPPQVQFPLSFEGQTRGLWTVGARRDGEDFSSADRRILQTLARQAEIGLSNVLLIEALRRQLDEVREAQRQLLRSREEERARLARELHDGPIQSLVGLNMQVGLLLAPARAADSPPQEELAAMRAEVRGLLNELRQVCAELRPPMLDTMGLAAALRALAEEWTAQNGINVTLDVPPDASLRALPNEVSINLFRVAQEAIANVVRHAQAQRVTIRLTWERPHLSLTVQDDGRGFAVPAALHDLTARGHYGLAGLQERVDLIGGVLTLESAPGRGTTVRVAWQERGRETTEQASRETPA